MIYVIGIGEDGLDGLSEEAKKLIEGADFLVGGERHLDMTPFDETKVAWGCGLKEGMAEIKANLDKKIVVLATGEPLWFGVASSLLKSIEADHIQIYPTAGAFSLAAARLKWAIPDCACMTIHGRPVENLNREVFDGAQILLLSRDGKTPHEVAEQLVKYGYGDSEMTVLEHMGGPKEKQTTARAVNWQGEVENLNTIAILCKASEDARRLGFVPGLSDDQFDHDGQLTKKEVRAVTLANLAPQPFEHLWDVGAGCGSIAIEWMRVHPKNTASAIERHENRLKMIKANAKSLGVPTLEVIESSAPNGLADLKAPDAVFIGGGTSVDGLLETCWQALKPGGRLVANTVTLEGEQNLLAFQQEKGGQLTRIAISHDQGVGRFSMMKPAAPVLQLCAIKGM